MALRKKVRNIFFIIVFFAAAVVALNYFLAIRLEKYLKSELIQRVSEATDGFYSLSYNDLSINLLNGELKIEGIEFTPDSTIYNQWQAIDSLPDTYLKAKVGTIDFTGINLIWRWSYRRLHFSTFEIKDPEIEVFDAYYSERFQQKSKNIGTQTLYELVEPYIDVLSVQMLNLDHARVSYTVENPLTPIIYSMQDASFHAYGFWLDSLSSESGKLLYVDNFEFATNQPQILLTNNDFTLHTDSIRLSTSDSVIYIRKIRLLPQEDIWKELKVKPDNYIDGQIETIEINGIAFKREKGLNYLKARSFNILSSDIKAFNLMSKNADNDSIRKETPTIDTDSLIQALSVYDIISPVLSSVSIDEINLDKTKLTYSLLIKDSIETYQIDDFNFHAYDFLVDSLSEQEHGFWYSQNFDFEITGMEGFMTARNHRLHVGRIALDTYKKYFIIENIKLNPISTRTNNDYLMGNIDTIIINELVYDNGISAGLFKIESPNIRYIRAPKSASEKINTASSVNNRVDVEAILNPFFNYLFIREINLSHANFTMVDQDIQNHATYKINDFNFFATHFRIDKKTSQNKNIFFDCDDFGFRFSNFDNFLPGNDYRLLVDNGSFSSLTGKLRLENIALIPQEKTWEKAPAVYSSVTIPLIQADGFNKSIHNLSKNIMTGNILIESPDVKIVETTKSQTTREDNKELSFPDFIKNDFSLTKLQINNPAVSFQSLEEKNTIKTSLKSFLVKHISFKKSLQDITIEKLILDSLRFSLEKTDNHISFVLDKFIMDSLDWSLKKNNSYFNLTLIDIRNPHLAYNSLRTPENTSETGSKKESIYSQLGNFAKHISLNKFNLENAKVSFANRQKDLFKTISELGTIDLTVEGLKIDNENESFRFEDIAFHTNNLHIPIDNNFFNLHIGDITIKDRNLRLDSLTFTSPYPMLGFAIAHPKHADWFDVRAGTIELNDIDFRRLFENKTIKAKSGRINDALLENFRNQQLPPPRRLVPMIYEGLQKAPVKIDIDELAVNNLAVTYYELAKKGKEPGKIFFTNMNGIFHGLTNIATCDSQFIRLDANAKLMGDGFFTATWMLPVDTLYDRFLLDAHLPQYNLTTLNNIITPLAPARVRSGAIQGLRFSIDASSLGANIDMLFLYNDLKVDYLKEKNGEMVKNKFISALINWVVRDNNPRRPNGKPHHVNIDIIRDPYHSTFNYLWQILRPSVAESAGISYKLQKLFGPKTPKKEEKKKGEKREKE